MSARLVGLAHEGSFNGGSHFCMNIVSIYVKKEIHQFCVHREAFFMLGSDVSHLFSAETKKPLDAETPFLSDPRYSLIS